MSQPSPLERFLDLLGASIRDGSLVKLTLGKHQGNPNDLHNIYVRPVALKSGPHYCFVYRYQSKDITKNHPATQALEMIRPLLGRDFLDAHLFTPTQTAQFTTSADGKARLHTKVASASPKPAPSAHDREREHLVPPSAGWLRDLGVTNERGQVREGMAGKFRQINRFVELLSHLVDESALPDGRPFRVVDMGCGKGYLTFGVASYFGPRALVTGIEARPELVRLCNQAASRHGLANLSFAPGTILDAALTEKPDVFIALHACDTATDDALARGIAADAALLVVSPCCQKELRHQLTAPSVLKAALRHGIFQDRQAEFATDALRAHLLEWAGYRTKVFEFISTEHTAKNLMISALKAGPGREAEVESRIQDFAAFYGVRHQRLAEHLRFPLAPSR